MKTQSFICPIEDCSKAFNKEEDLDEHLENHKFGDDKDFTCPKCDRILATKQSLKEHIFTHTGKKPFKCTEIGCGKTFRQSSQLCNHRKVHKEAQKIMMKKLAQKKKPGDKVSQEINNGQKFPFELGIGKNIKVTLPPIMMPGLGCEQNGL